MSKLARRLWQDESGQDLIEYALLLVLISLVCVATIATLGQAISNVYTNAATNLSTQT